MARHHTSKDFFRQIPNAVLARYFFKIGEDVLNQEPQEIPDDENGNPFLDLASLLGIKVSVGKLASVIESEGIYTWDKYGRFGFANDIDKKRALDLIEIFYNRPPGTAPKTAQFLDTLLPRHHHCNHSTDSLSLGPPHHYLELIAFSIIKQFDTRPGIQCARNTLYHINRSTEQQF